VAAAAAGASACPALINSMLLSENDNRHARDTV
jgi:hypothetical protein